MKSILMIVSIMIALIAGVGFSLNALAGDSKTAPVHSGCLTSCHDCAAVCINTLAYCHKQGGKHIDPAHLKAMTDCIATCKLSEDFMDRNSPLMEKACALCKDACLKCADACDTFKGDKTMQNCAEECRKCADSCQKMSG